MVAWPEALVRELADRRVLLFIGAGISKAASPATPTWGQLLTGLSAKLAKGTDRKLVGQLIRQNDLLDAAQVISDGVVRADINAKLRDAFQPNTTPHHGIYKDILSLDLKTVVTTNYDEFIEKNFEHYSGGNAAYSVLRYTSNDLLEHLRSPSRLVVKVHGCITEPGKVVLDRSSYFKARQQNRGFFDVISSLFTVNTVLFIGYSLGDPDMQIILENIHAASESSHGHYSLLPKQKHRSLVSALRQTYNISCIEYPEGAHNLVPDYLASLAAAVSADRSARGIV
jgi:hypothetical protein